MDIKVAKEHIQDCIGKMELQEAYDLIVQYKKIFNYDDEVASMEAIINIYDGNYEEALKCIREGLKINIFNSDLYFTMGNIYELNEKFNNAYLCYEHALNIVNNVDSKNVILSTIDNLKIKDKLSVNKYSIVILTYNNLDYTKVCIDSIRKYNNSDTYEIIIIDNNSTDGTVEWIEEQKDIKYILNPENKGFPAGCNQGVEIAEKDNDIFLLNNDTVIMPNSILNLRLGLYSEEKVGATGSVSNSVSYYQQISETYNDFDGYMDYALRNNIADEQAYEQRVKLVGFAMLIKRGVLDKVGLLDERFTPGNFEDDDISLRIVMEGYKLLLCKDSYIHHFGSVTFSKDNSRYSTLLKVNSKKFGEKWGFKIEYSTFIRYDLINLINEDKNRTMNILEVGCATGATMLAIKSKYPNASIYGIEIDENSAKVANCFADVRSENIENIDLSYEERFFDYILFPDVLEHLYDPEKVLNNMKKYLKDDGSILTSIPNVMHYSVIRGLLQGNWTYQEAGILDKTHIRFFTKNEIMKMFQRLEYLDLSFSYTSIGMNNEDKKFINAVLSINNCISKEELNVYQYLVKARKKRKEYNEINNNNNKFSQKSYNIDSSCDVRGIEYMRFSDGVVIQQDCWLDIANTEATGVIIDIGRGSNIGRRCVISAANKITIGEKVLIAPNVYIADCQHEYSDINKYIMDQGINCYKNEVKIGDGTWVGINSSILGNVVIGKNCVIGANSFVNSNIPDYSIAVGNPAKIIKMYDTIDRKWVRTHSDNDVEEVLQRRKKHKYFVDFKKLKSLQVEVSSVCNLKCPQCFNNIPGHKSKIMTKSMWENNIRPVLSQLTDIHLVGIGEPLLCKDFFEYVTECSELGITVHTTSNLQLVNEEIAEKIIKSGIKYLSFSCDGATKETYNRIRVNGDFDKLLESIQLINKYKELYNSKYPVLILNFGAIKSNINELLAVVRLAKENKVEQVISYHDIIYVRELEEESLYYDQERSDNIFNEANTLAQELEISYFYPGTFNKPIKYSLKDDKNYCNYPYSHLWVYSDGRVGPCCMDFPNRIILGDLKKSSIEEIWNDKPIRELRESLCGNTCDTCKYCSMHGKMDISNKNYLIKY